MWAMQLRSPLLPIAALLVSACLVAAATQERNPAVETRAVRGQVSYLVGNGGNVGVMLGKDGVLMVDDKFADNAKPIEEAIKALGGGAPAWLVNTHWHPDHTGGNKDLGEAGGLIVAHGNVRRRLSTDQFIEIAKMKVPSSPPRALPVVTFDDAVTLHLNGDEIHAFHVPPAHTDGDSVVHFRRANVVHMGDLFFNAYPFFDLSSDGSFEGLITAADRVLAFADEKTRIIPGHGPVSGRADLQAYRDMLATVRDRVKPRVQGGQTLEQITAARPTADLDARWGQGYIKPDVFLGLVVQSLTRDGNKPK
jgi:cyclase